MILSAFYLMVSLVLIAITIGLAIGGLALLFMRMPGEVKGRRKIFLGLVFWALVIPVGTTAIVVYSKALDESRAESWRKYGP